MQCAHGTVRMCAALPNGWLDVAFYGIRTDGAFLMSGRSRDGEIEAVRVFSEAGAPLRVVNPFGERGCIVGSGEGASRHVNDPVIEMETKPGQVIVLSPAV